MLHLIPAPLHRALYRVAYTLRRHWWRIRRPQLSGVMVVAYDEQGRVLLVRHSYGPPMWSIPGGGMERGEDPEAAAAREVHEELGCGLNDLVSIDSRVERVQGSHNCQHTFLARVVGRPVPDMREIVAVAFFDPEDLPQDCGRRSRERIMLAMAYRATAAGSEQR